MITHIEIDGFKSFYNFKIDLNPFQAFVGWNGAGKSNLFDAIMLLSHLAGDNTLREAFSKSRGEISELFSLLPDGERSRMISLRVEMLIGKTVLDDLGEEKDVSSTRLRYELKIERRAEVGFERLYVMYETLNAITEDDDQWIRSIKAKYRKQWIIRSRRTPYISTDSTENRIFRHQDGVQGNKLGIPLGRIERTVLSLVNSAAYPTAYAARQEMLKWRFLQLDPVVLRLPSSVYSPVTLSENGNNLAAVLYHLSQDRYALTDISRDMANLVPGIKKIQVGVLPEREEYAIEAISNDGARFSSRVLSDGTLRILALATLSNDLRHSGVICFEEPENGVHPFQLAQMVRLLNELSTDLNMSATDPDDDDVRPLSQIILNTHSPKLLADLPDNAPIYYLEMRVRDGIRQTVAFLVNSVPVTDPAQDRYSRLQIQNFLESDNLERKRAELGEVADPA